jgi:hypothetical protein
MPVELSDLMQLALGQRDHLKMGDLPRTVAEITGCHPAIVYLGKREFWHIARSHPEMQREEFQLVPWLLKDGSYYVDERRPNQMTIYGRLQHDRKLYALCLKAVDHGCEVWVQTMYRIDDKKAQRRSKNMTLIFGPSIF